MVRSCYRRSETAADLMRARAPEVRRSPSLAATNVLAHRLHARAQSQDEDSTPCVLSGDTTRPVGWWASAVGMEQQRVSSRKPSRSIGVFCICGENCMPWSRWPHMAACATASHAGTARCRARNWLYARCYAPFSFTFAFLSWDH